jgi:hypothetical protein
MGYGLKRPETAREQALGKKPSAGMVRRDGEAPASERRVLSARGRDLEVDHYSFTNRTGASPPPRSSTV